MQLRKSTRCFLSRRPMTKSHDFGSMFGNTEQKRSDPPNKRIASERGKSWSRWSGLNRRPAVYETAALPLSYTGVAYESARRLL